ncbi:hypothetical protein STSP2_01811 [Anaerohalosphaera lusitana]|uniref:DUF5320 domain-containing protein n=1 Tax=Anaerohalosphaera lusitana TaxID=1936003 RepID=A0A1U9NL33_9BACT|nr:DUF5320 domain-containing protein [Anaerohalosphaera lusitana]AQT68643.1 hypothetical protein STSP2_01811 [Anaerohalosphaera lusitana]
MPFRDGTGPNGAGPLTGRGMGPCSGDAYGRAPRRGYFGRGPGRGRGFGRGFRNWAGGGWGFGGAPVDNPENYEPASENLTDLEAQAQGLRESLNDLESRIKSMKEEK